MILMGPWSVGKATRALVLFSCCMAHTHAAGDGAVPFLLGENTDRDVLFQQEGDCTIKLTQAALQNSALTVSLKLAKMWATCTATRGREEGMLVLQLQSGGGEGEQQQLPAAAACCSSTDNNNNKRACGKDDDDAHNAHPEDVLSLAHGGPQGDLLHWLRSCCLLGCHPINALSTQKKKRRARQLANAAQLIKPGCSVLKITIIYIYITILTKAFSRFLMAASTYSCYGLECTQTLGLVREEYPVLLTRGIPSNAGTHCTLP